MQLINLTEVVTKLLRQGYSITEIEQAFAAELELIQKTKPLLLAQKESDRAP
jgi:PIN domain nuclease of toxin-antitoxin system